MKKNKVLVAVLFMGFASIGYGQNTKEVAKEYLALYTSMKFDDLHKYYTNLSIFEDPTTSFFHPAGKYESKTGADSIVAYLKDGFSKISNLEFAVEVQYSAGVILYSYGTLKYDYSILQKNRQKTIRIELPLSIVLEIKDGKIIHHQDIADYEAWYLQYKNQIDG